MLINKKKVIIFIGALLLLFVSLIVGFRSINKTDDSPEPELGEYSVVRIVDQNNEVYDSFTNSDYLQLKKKLSVFIKEQGGDSMDTVEVSNLQRPVRVGFTTTMDVKIPSLNKTVQVKIIQPSDGSDVDKIEIPEYNYIVDLNDIRDLDHGP